MGFAIESFQKYAGSGLAIGFFLLALIFLWVKEKRKPRRILFVYTPVLLLFLVFNPVFSGIFERVVGPETFFRLFWLLPYLTVLSYTAVLLTEQFQGQKKAAAAVAVIVLIAVSGKLVYSNPLYSRAENKYHVPDSVVSICDAIAVPGREVIAVFPRELLLYVRQYSPVVCMPYGREVLMGMNNSFYDVMEAEQIDLEELLSYTRDSRYQCNYIVLRRDKKILGNPTEQGLELFYETEKYLVYRDTQIELTVPQL